MNFGFFFRNNNGKLFREITGINLNNSQICMEKGRKKSLKALDYDTKKNGVYIYVYYIFHEL